MNDIFPLGKKWFRLGAMDYTTKAGKQVKAYGLEEVRVVPDGEGGTTYERQFQGTRLQCDSPDQLRRFLVTIGNALPTKNGAVKDALEPVLGNKR